MGSRYGLKNTYSRRSTAPKRSHLDDKYRSDRSDRAKAYRRGPNAPAGVPRAMGALVTSEMKYFDSERAETLLSSVSNDWVAGNFFPPTSSLNLGNPAVVSPNTVFCPQTGNGLNGRIGRKCHLYKVRITGTIVIPQQSAQGNCDPACKIRILLVHDKQTNGAAFTPIQLMSSSTSGAEVTINSFQNPQNFGRFNVLKDKTIVLQNPSVAGQTPSIDTCGMKYHFKLNYRWPKGLLFNFNATNGGTVADLIDNSIHVIVATDNASLGPRCAYYARCCFKD